MIVRRRVVGIIAATTVVSMLGLPQATSAAPREFDCVTAASEMVDGVSQEAIESACREIAQKREMKGAGDVPTAFMAWAAVGVVNNSGNIGFPVSGVCIYEATPSGVDQNLQPRALHVVAGSAQSIGPALSTTINCSVSPVGLSASGTFLGPAAVAGNAKFGGFRSQTVCVTAVGRFIDTSVTTAGPDCSPAL